MKYCNNCKQMIEPQKKFNTIVFIILFCCTCFGWIIYLLYYFLKTPNCPMCGSTNWGVMPSESTSISTAAAPVAAPVAAPAKASKFCPNCGSPVKGDEKYCSSCGSEL